MCVLSIGLLNDRMFVFVFDCERIGRPRLILLSLGKRRSPLAVLDMIASLPDFFFFLDSS